MSDTTLSWICENCASVNVVPEVLTIDAAICISCQQRSKLDKKATSLSISRHLRSECKLFPFSFDRTVHCDRCMCCICDCLVKDCQQWDSHRDADPNDGEKVLHWSQQKLKMRSKLRNAKLKEIESEISASNTFRPKHKLLLQVGSPSNCVEKKKKKVLEDEQKLERPAKRAKRQSMVLNVGDIFYVPLLTWYKDASECKFPEPKGQWVVKGQIQAVTGMNAKRYKILFPVFEQECSKPISYFETYASLTLSVSCIVVTGAYVNLYEPEQVEDADSTDST